jgi:hypothetical protein
VVVSSGVVAAASSLSSNSSTSSSSGSSNTGEAWGRFYETVSAEIIYGQENICSNNDLIIWLHRYKIPKNTRLLNTILKKSLYVWIFWVENIQSLGVKINPKNVSAETEFCRIDPLADGTARAIMRQPKAKTRVSLFILLPRDLGPMLRLLLI